MIYSEKQTNKKCVKRKHVDILEQVEPSYEFLVCDSSHAPDQIPPTYTIDAYIGIYKDE